MSGTEQILLTLGMVLLCGSVIGIIVWIMMPVNADAIEARLRQERQAQQTSPVTEWRFDEQAASEAAARIMNQTYDHNVSVVHNASINLNTIANQIDITAFGDSQRTYLPGLRDHTFSFTVDSVQFTQNLERTRRELSEQQLPRRVVVTPPKPPEPPPPVLERSVRQIRVRDEDE